MKAQKRRIPINTSNPMSRHGLSQFFPLIRINWQALHHTCNEAVQKFSELNFKCLDAFNFFINFFLFFYHPPKCTPFLAVVAHARGMVLLVVHPPCSSVYDFISYVVHSLISRTPPPSLRAIHPTNPPSDSIRHSPLYKLVSIWNAPVPRLKRANLKSNQLINFDNNNNIDRYGWLLHRCTVDEWRWWLWLLCCCCSCVGSN